MASNFSANQYEKEFSAKQLSNWEVPHWYPKHPIRRNEATKFIANDRGHLLDFIERPKTNPWGRFQNTWQLPGKITRDIANEISSPQLGGSRWAMPDPDAITIKTQKEEIVESIQIEMKDKKVTKPTNEDAKPSVEIQLEKSTEKVFIGKAKLNNPIAIIQQGRHSIRHETLERDYDEH
ncbi:unnamed protein product [Diamesa serratosioi]